MATSWHQGAVGHQPARTAQVLLVCMIVAVVVFEALRFGVVTHTGLAIVDPAVLDWAVARRSVGLVAAARVVTDIGSPAVTISVTIVVLGWWGWRRDRRGAGVGVLGIVGLIVVDVAAKNLVARPRPPVPLHVVVAHGYSFPSGHAMLSSGAALVLLWAARQRLAAVASTVHRLLAIASISVVVLAVGGSRVVLGVHYPSDILAGWALAGLVVAATALLDVATPSRCPGRLPR